MKLNDELDALAEAHGYICQTSEGGDHILIRGHGFRVRAEASAGEDGIEYDLFAPEQEAYPEVIDSLLGLANEILQERYSSETTH